MLKNYAFMLEYQYDGIKYVSEANENNHYSISATASKDAIKITLEPKVKISLTNAYIKYKYNYLDSDRIYVNGYQSWTTSREYTKENVQRGLLGLSKVPPVRCLSTLTGDYDFQYYSLKKGEFHSYSYTYINSSGKIKLFGTLSERTGYTIFHHNMNTSELIVQKDVEGVTIDQPYVVFDIYAAEGSYNEVFDKYFAILALPKLKYKHMSGYTSWYNYYGAITEEILSRDIDGLATLGDKVDIFQIDDGYQTATGDWLSVKTELYPNGMKYLVDKIHSKGYKAGLWLAPFNAQRSSKVVKQHKDWLIKEPNSDKLQLGCIAWGGAYTLDF
ncbi:MAG: alpha-galactosidase, partial [Bacilli bacterium]